MKKRIITGFALLAFAVNIGTTALADVPSKGKTARASQLVALLPAADGVATVDAKAFFGTALPTVLSGNQPLLAKVTGHLDEFKGKTGIDLRQFDQMAIGFTARQITGKKFDVEHVVLARGQVNAGSLVGAAKLAANGKYREERVGSRTVYIFAAKEIAAQHKPQTTGSTAAGVEKGISRLPSEIAVTVYDSNTIAFGSMPMLRQTLEGKTKLGSDISTLLNGQVPAVVNFASKMPAGMKSFLPIENDELGKNIESIRYLYGRMDVAAGSATVQTTARTQTAANATGLHETLEGLQLLGKAFLGSTNTADKQVYARMIDNARFTAKGTDVTLDLVVPQSDLDILVSKIK